MKMISGMSAVAKLGGCILFIITCSSSATADGVHHYVFFNRDRKRISDAAFVGTKVLEGAQLKYTWRELEPDPDAYDFSAVQHDLLFLTSKGKRLFIQIQDVSFDPTVFNIPRYLLK